MASGDADHLSHLVADYKAQALSITAPCRIAIVVVEAIFNCVDLIRGEVVPKLYLKGHIVIQLAVIPPRLVTYLWVHTLSHLNLGTLLRHQRRPNVLWA